MSAAKNSLQEAREELVVALARTGDRAAFEELVRRRQAWLRSLTRRFSGDTFLADDLAQQVFLQAWRDIKRVRDPRKFGPWLRRLAVNTWLKHLRKNDPLRGSDEGEDDQSGDRLRPDVKMDVDRALATLAPHARLCMVMSYHEGLSHGEIANLSGIPLGTVKSHIRRSTEELKLLLSAYTP